MNYICGWMLERLLSLIFVDVQIWTGTLQKRLYRKNFTQNYRFVFIYVFISYTFDTAFVHKATTTRAWYMSEIKLVKQPYFIFSDEFWTVYLKHLKIMAAKKIGYCISVLWIGFRNLRFSPREGWLAVPIFILLPNVITTVAKDQSPGSVWTSR